MAEVTIPIATGKAAVPPSAALLAACFQTDPVIQYLLNSLTPARRISYLTSYFASLMTAASMNHAQFSHIDAQSGEWQSLGVLMPPGRRVDNPWTIVQAGFLKVLWNIGAGGIKRMLAEYTPVTDAAKARHLKPLLSSADNYYYVFFLATAEAGRGKGLCSQIVKEFQEQARKEKVPIWLEATTEYSMQLYKKLGFNPVEEIILGKGKVGKDGLKGSGTEGVKIWAMIWNEE